MLSRLLQVELSPGQESRRSLPIPRERDDPRADGQQLGRVVRTASKLDPSDRGSNSLRNTHSLGMACVQQEHTQSHGETPHHVCCPDELGDPARENRLDPLLEFGFVFGDIGFEQAEGEEVPVAGSTSSLPEEKVKEGFVLEETCRRIEKGHDLAPRSPAPHFVSTIGSKATRVRWTSRQLPHHGALTREASIVAVAKPGQEKRSHRPCIRGGRLQVTSTAASAGEEAPAGGTVPPR